MLEKHSHKPLVTLNTWIQQFMNTILCKKGDNLIIILGKETATIVNYQKTNPKLSSYTRTQLGFHKIIRPLYILFLKLLQFLQVTVCLVQSDVRRVKG